MTDRPDDYDPHRRHRTRTEVEGRSKADVARGEKNRTARKNNRKASHFGKVNWEVYQHDQLYDMIMRADPAKMSDHVDRWARLAGAIERTTGDVQAIVQEVMATWQGQAAVSAADANTRLMTWAGTASHTADQIAVGMSTYTDAVIHAQRKMPEPGYATAERNFRDGYTVTTTGGPSDAVFLKELLSDGMVSHKEARERKAEAVAVMESYEARSKDVHDSMPRFDGAAPEVHDSPAWTSDPHDGSADGSTGGSTDGGSTTTGPGPADSPPAPSTVPGANASTVAAGYVDPLLSGSAGAGGSGGPGGTGYGGGVGSLSGGGGGGDAVRGGPGFGAGALAGRGVPGGAGVIGGVPGGAAGARGGAGAFGGMPMGAGANGAEDTEHKNKYDEGLDLLADLPPAYPPVFGA